MPASLCVQDYMYVNIYQARAPSSPVIIVGTHSDKMTSVEQQAELNESLKQVTKLYGDCDDQIKGIYMSIPLSLYVYMHVCLRQLFNKHSIAL